MGRLSNLIQERFGGRTDSRRNPVVSQLGVTATEFLRPNDDRLQFILINLSLFPVFILPDSEVSTSNGIRLIASGGTIISNWEDDADLVGVSWFGIGDGGAANILVIETFGI